MSKSKTDKSEGFRLNWHELTPLYLGNSTGACLLTDFLQARKVSADIPPSLLLYSIYVFPTVLAVCILGTPSSYTLFVSTPLSHPIGCHHITRFATPPYFPETTL
jgi:hypothetical protein